MSAVEMLERLRRRRITVVGDAMLDEYVEGTAERICPEAPVPVVRVEASAPRPGGAANVARNVTALGGHADLAAVVGIDAAGERLHELCSEAGIGLSALLRAEDRQTTRKVRVLARGQQLLRLDWERPEPLPAAVEQALLDRVEALARPDALVLSDYAKGVLTPSLLRALILRGRQWGAPVLVDPKSTDFDRYRGATGLTPNRQELERALGVRLPAAEPHRIVAAARPLLDRLELEHLVVTCGPEGLVAVTRDVAETIRAAPREVYDVTGAGDTVIATLALALAAGLPLPVAAGLANAAAGLVVGRVGTAVVTPAELARVLAAAQPGKVLDPAALRERVALWRLEGRRIVFTNGCFDLLHVGHVALLETAARHGDALVVGLNGDRSVARLKGRGRPLVPASARAAMLAALECVDAVVIFEEDTPLELIAQVAPAVLVKGADYRLAEVVGREQVEAAGGEVVLVPLVPGHSTTSLVARLRQPDGGADR